MLKKIIEKSTLVALCTAPYALAENKISWEKGFYRSWSCEILDPSSIYEAPSKMELYTVGRGLEGPRRNYTFEALVVLAFAQATSDPLGERNVIAFSGTLKKDETVSENVFRF
ncbi:MAG: hypothetical protein ABIR96_11235, partial [Bdellovibrionota bacterium]